LGASGVPGAPEKPVTAKSAKNSRKGREDQPPHFLTDCWRGGFDEAASVFPAGRLRPRHFDELQGWCGAFSGDRYFVMIEDAFANGGS
jgi:hypothetical protein